MAPPTAAPCPIAWPLAPSKACRWAGTPKRWNANRKCGVRHPYVSATLSNRPRLRLLLPRPSNPKPLHHLIVLSLRVF